jgi:predicted transcriptional regulator
MREFKTETTIRIKPYVKKQLDEIQAETGASFSFIIGKLLENRRIQKKASKEATKKEG